MQNYAGLLATRFFLGLFETGMFPGCFYLLGKWSDRRTDTLRARLSPPPPTFRLWPRD